MRILLDNKELILSSEELDVSSANPILKNDEDRLDLIFSIKIPITGNEKAIGYLDNIDVINENEYDAEIISALNFRGIGFISDISKEENTATLQIGYAKNKFSYLIKDKKLNELDFGTIECSKRLIFSAITPMTILSSTSSSKVVQPTLHYYQGSSDFMQGNMLYFPEAAEIKLNIQGAFTNTDGANNTTITRINLYYKKNNGTNELIQTIDATGGLETIVSASFNVNGEIGDTIEIIIGIIHNAAYYGPTITLYFLCTINKLSFIESINADENSNYCFPMLQNKNMMSSLPDGITKTFYNDIMPLMNNVFTGEKSLNLIYNNYSYTKLIAPCFKVQYLLDMIFESLGYILDREKFSLIYNKLIVFTGNIIAEYNANNEYFYLDIPENYKLSNSFNNDILISDFLKDVYFITGFFPIFNHETRNVELIDISKIYTSITKIEAIIIKDTIDYKSDEKGISLEIKAGEDSILKDYYSNLEEYNYKGEVTNLSDLANGGLGNYNIGDCYYITSERKYYAYLYGKATEAATSNTLHWQLISYDYRLYIEEGKDTFVSFKSETPIMVGTTTSIAGDGTTIYNNINIPITQQAIIIDKAYDTYENKYSNSFMIVRGKKTQTGLGEYLYASADNYYAQIKENGLSLRCDGEDGLIKRVYKTISQIYSTGKKHTMSAYMTATEIDKLTYRNLIEIDNCINIILSYNYKLKDNKFMEVELELIKI